MALNPYLGTLFGFQSMDASQGLGISQTLALYRQSVDGEEKETARLQKDPMVRRDLAMLDKAIAKAKTPEELLKNPEARRVLMEGLGLADQAENAGLAIKALLSDTTKSGNLASQLTDTRWTAAAKQLDFAASGMKKLQDPAFMATIASGVVDYRRLTAISDKSQAVADALSIRELPNETPNVYSVLGDKVMRRVATAVAGLPDTLALQSVEAQARTLEKSFDLSRFSTTEKRDKLITMYLVTAQSNSGSTLSII